MKTAKFILGLVALSLFCSCVKYEGEKKVYPGKEKQPDNYYVPGHEYRIIARKIEDPELLKFEDGPSSIYLRLVKILSAKKRFNCRSFSDRFANLLITHRAYLALKSARYERFGPKMLIPGRKTNHVCTPRSPTPLSTSLL